MKGFFVTGTDTEIGKTEVCVALLRLLGLCGFTTTAMKPVASGAERTAQGLRNEDALRLMAAATQIVDYDDVNPFAFEPAIAPHLAAALLGRQIDGDVIRPHFQKLAEHSECVVVEGVGGWLVPLGGDYTVEQLACELGLPVILVVGLRLGCLNHALLSERAILSSGCQLAGWVANHHLPDFDMAAENIDTLKRQMRTPLLGILPHAELKPDSDLSRYLDRDSIVKNIKN